MIRAGILIRNFAILLIVIAVGMRAAIPSGWMPSAERGIALTVCVGGDTQIVWMDNEGNLSDHEPGDAVEHSPCAFAGAALAIDISNVAEIASIAPTATVPPSVPQTGTATGLGLAAPPPPSTGPPHLV